jgi:dihydropyrimidine dehydrogenase (NAD+) subunit PreA
MGFNNIELISDRPLDQSPRDRECIRLFPDRAMVVSLMADNTRESWHELIAQSGRHRRAWLRAQLRLSPRHDRKRHGRSVGQDPEIARMVVEWVMEKATIPVITKLTPNVHSVVPTAKP